MTARSWRDRRGPAGSSAGIMSASSPRGDIRYTSAQGGSRAAVEVGWSAGIRWPARGLQVTAQNRPHIGGRGQAHVPRSSVRRSGSPPCRRLGH